MIKHYDSVKKTARDKTNKVNKDLKDKLSALNKAVRLVTMSLSPSLYSLSDPSQEQDTTKIRDQLDAIKQDEKTRRKTIDTLQKEVDKLTAIVANVPPPVDSAAITAEIVSGDPARGLLRRKTHRVPSS
jgi:hypothetical protein